MQNVFLPQPKCSGSIWRSLNGGDCKPVPIALDIGLQSIAHSPSSSFSARNKCRCVDLQISNFSTRGEAYAFTEI